MNNTCYSIKNINFVFNDFDLWNKLNISRQFKNQILTLKRKLPYKYYFELLLNNDDIYKVPAYALINFHQMYLQYLLEYEKLNYFKKSSSCN